MNKTHYDIVLYGATGFVGRLVAARLANHPDRNAFSWAIAGRNRKKLAALRAALAAGAGAKPGIVVAPLSDTRSVRAMVSGACVVLSTAGPYSLHQGRSLVACCASLGCDYADLSGEYWFQREMIEDFHAQAQRTGARIVLAAGVDSIPSDLGTQFAIEYLEKSGAPPACVKALYTDYAGAFSGGTVAAMQAMRKIAASDRYDDAFHHDPYLLAPDAAAGERVDRSVTGWDHFRYDADFRKFAGPFFMAPVNARIVRRSLALNQWLPCRYAEGIALTAWLKAGWLLASRGFGYFVGQPVPLRPKPGQGPPPWLRRRGGFRLLVKAFANSGRWVLVEVAGSGDPGYGATSRMFAEAGLCLLMDHDRLPGGGGVLTPATALGRVLRERLTTLRLGRFMRFRLLGQSGG